MSLNYEPSSEPLHNTAKQLFLNRELYRMVQPVPPEPVRVRVRHTVRIRVPGSVRVRVLPLLLILYSRYRSFRRSLSLNWCDTRVYGPQILRGYSAAGRIQVPHPGTGTPFGYGYSKNAFGYGNSVARFYSTLRHRLPQRPTALWNPYPKDAWSRVEWSAPNIPGSSSWYSNT